MNINNVTITGNMTRDPEIRYTQGGTAVLQFSVAVNDRVKNSQTGEWEDRPNYIDCTIFGKRAEGLSNMLHKGSKVGIVGKLHWSSWEKDGQKRSKVEVWPDAVELLTPKKDGSQGGHSASKDDGTRAAEEEFGVTMTAYDEELPF